MSSTGALVALPVDLAGPDAPVLLVGANAWWDRTGFGDVLGVHGWTWVSASDTARARWLASIRRIALVVIAGDTRFCRDALGEIRPLTEVPIVAVTDGERETLDLLRTGADLVAESGDSNEVLLARLLATFRRSDHRRGPGVRYLRAADLVVDLWTQECTRRGELISLSPTEYDLLTFLMTRATVTLATTTIVRRVWDHPPVDAHNALRIAVNRLRRKLGDSPESAQFIASVRGTGYRFAANVTEVADSLVDHATRVDVTPLLDSITAFAETVAQLDGELPTAVALIDAIDAAGLAEGLAVFRIDHERMHLVASRHMPESWLERVAPGVPLDPSFASAQSVLSGEVVQFADVRTVGVQFGATARELSGEGFRACHFVPIARNGEVWGNLGLARRSPSPLDPVTMAYLRSLCAAFLLGVDRSRTTLLTT